MSIGCKTVKWKIPNALNILRVKNKFSANPKGIAIGQNYEILVLKTNGFKIENDDLHFKNINETNSFSSTNKLMRAIHLCSVFI